MRHVIVALCIPIDDRAGPVPTDYSQEDLNRWLLRHDRLEYAEAPQIVSVLDPAHPAGGYEPQVFASHHGLSSPVSVLIPLDPFKPITDDAGIPITND